MNIVVNVSDAKVSADPAGVLTTYALGSCIGVTVYDPASRVGGMLHYQLPSAGADSDRAKEKPFMYADTGMDLLLSMMEQKGATRRGLTVKLAGGAELLGDIKPFNIGRRNHTAIRKILWQKGLLIAGEDVGGSTPRTLALHVGDGQVTVRADRRTTPL